MSDDRAEASTSRRDPGPAVQETLPDLAKASRQRRWLRSPFVAHNVVAVVVAVHRSPMLTAIGSPILRAGRGDVDSTIAAHPTEVAHPDGAGRVILEREHNVIAEFAGALSGTYRPGELNDLRSEWD